MMMSTSTRRLKNGRQTTYIVLLLIVVLAMIGLRRCSGTRPLTQGEETRPGGDTINVGIEYSPLAVMSLGGDSLGGFGYEMMQAIARQEGLSVNYHPVVKLSKALELLDSGFFDIVIAEMPVTAEMRRRHRFSHPVFLDRQVLVQRIDSSVQNFVNSQLDLGGHTVTVVAGSSAATRIANLSREIGDTIYVVADSVHSPEQLFMLTAAGDVRMAVINESTARSLAADFPEVDVSKAVSFTQLQSWALTQRNKALADSIDAAMQRFMSTPEYIGLLRRHHLDPPSR